ncbi:hypothetical protein Bbelb_387830, partial [Branchiostoma belcheri]
MQLGWWKKESSPIGGKSSPVRFGGGKSSLVVSTKFYESACDARAPSVSYGRSTCEYGLLT